MLLDAADSTVLIVDMQERLMPAIMRAEDSAARARVLAQGAQLLGVPVLATEHNADALGATISSLQCCVQSVFHKRHFSAAGEPGFEAWLPPGRKTILVAGWESHVCVLQTILGLQAAGWRPVLVADAASSRHQFDYDIGMRRIQAAGVPLITTEMALFEWMGSCDHTQFKQVLRLVK
ncbi:isochorismatase family protein [Bordetella sp. 15P40C-2]|uniref:isochorismatase family protein n=1 Tax=Bordetella sp. 15P40C-2 TaxID=2572246 RepID=UPI0013298FF2|nr:isochorismatase family protein [Bordetella sp. 15P40C-2]MVW73481.1 isochorismatase family protein [Bordetella sp. 15P40C-2]